MKRPPRSTVIPLALLVYLGIMAWIGRDEFLNGNYGYYFTIIGLTLGCIIALHFFLKKRDRLRRERMEDIRRNEKKDGVGE